MPVSFLCTCTGVPKKEFLGLPVIRFFQFCHTFFLQECLLQRFYGDKDEKIKALDTSEAHSPVEGTDTYTTDNGKK